jgi:hypothetical protein
MSRRRAFDVPALILQIADAVTNALNAASLSLTFDAQRTYVPIHELTEIDGLLVTVVPVLLGMTIISRRDDEFTYSVDIGVQKRIGIGTMSDAQIKDACDPLMGFVEEILDLFRGEAVIAMIPARFDSATNAPIFVPSHIDEKKTFTSVLTLTFKESRAR